MGLIDDLVGQSFGDATRSVLTAGTDEEDLVNSGLEETMITAFDEILEIRNRFRSIKDMRTAAYVSAIQKVATSYLELGVFP